MQEYINLPPEYLLKNSAARSKFYDDDLKPLKLVTHKGKETKPGSKTIKQFLSTTNDDFADFIEKCI